jgi:pectate lyase
MLFTQTYTMKAPFLLLALLFSFSGFAQQHTTLTHGSTFGTKPDRSSVIDAGKLEAFMAQKTRISTSVKGTVLKVTKQKGGWFDLDAGNGKVIAVHFKSYAIDLPADLKGRTVIVGGVAQKQFIADDEQHFAGDTVKGKKQHNVKTNPNRKLSFEATGLVVE